MTKQSKPSFGFGAAKKQPWEYATAVLDRTEKEAAIRDYLKTGGINLDPATQAWCAAFVNSSLVQAGQKGTGSPSARSFLRYGEPVLQPRKGDIAVFKRSGDRPEDAGLGHAGFYMDEEYPGYISTLGGNQGDAVNVMPIESNRVLGFRRSPGAAAEPPEAQSLTATLPPDVAARVFDLDMSRNLNRTGTAYGLPGNIGGTITPKLDAMFGQAVNTPRFLANAQVPDASLPTTEIPASLWWGRRR